MNADKDGDFEVIADNPEISDDEDQGFDNLEDAVDALSDDDEVVDETAEAEGEGEEDPEPEGEADETTDAVITLPDGDTMTVADFEEMRGNSLRAADYTRKTTELAEERKSVVAEREAVAKRSQHLETAFQGLVQYLEGVIPAEPALELARSNPNEYQYQKAMRQQALAEIAPLLEMKEDAQSQLAQVSQEDLARYQEKENAALVKAMPHLSDPIKRTAFDDAIKKTAGDFGFTPEELAQTYDNRVLQVLHYARLGKVAETNRRNAARRVETPRKGRAKPVKAAPNAQNTQAMQRLAKSGSIEDAMRIDFD